MFASTWLKGGHLVSEPPDIFNLRMGNCREIAITLKTIRESTVGGYRGVLWPFKIRRMATIVFQFRVVAGAP